LLWKEKKDVIVKGFCTLKAGGEVPVLDCLQSGVEVVRQDTSPPCKNTNPSASRSKSRTAGLGEYTTSSEYSLCQDSELKVLGWLFEGTG